MTDAFGEQARLLAWTHHCARA